MDGDVESVVECAKRIFNGEEVTMPIYAPPAGGKVYPLADEGLVEAVCSQVEDLGNLPNDYKPGEVKHMISIRWNEIVNAKGEECDVRKRYTLSMHEKSTLTKDLKTWMGEIPKNFDLESLVGKKAKLTLCHVEHDGKTYANVLAVRPA